MRGLLHTNVRHHTWVLLGVETRPGQRIASKVIILTVKSRTNLVWVLGIDGLHVRRLTLLIPTTEQALYKVQQVHLIYLSCPVFTELVKKLFLVGLGLKHMTVRLHNSVICTLRNRQTITKTFIGTLRFCKTRRLTEFIDHLA